MCTSRLHVRPRKKTVKSFYLVVLCFQRALFSIRAVRSALARSVMSLLPEEAREDMLICG